MDFDFILSDMEFFCDMILLRDELMDTGVILVEAPRGRFFFPPETFWNSLPEFVRRSAPPEAKMENGDGLFNH